MICRQWRYSLLTARSSYGTFFFQNYTPARVIISYAYQFTTYFMRKPLARFWYTPKNKQQFPIKISFSMQVLLTPTRFDQKCLFKTLLAWLVTLMSTLFENLISWQVLLTNLSYIRKHPSYKYLTGLWISSTPLLCKNTKGNYLKCKLIPKVQ